MATTTILFTDLVNSSELLSRVGDQVGHHIFASHYEKLRATVEAYGGEVVKWQGDGIMGRFQSVSDAVHAAIAGQRATEQPIQGERLAMRAGLHVGETAVWDETDLFGMPVVVARRLCEAANSGQVLCSSLVEGLLPHGHELKLQDVGHLRLKGIDEPISTVAVLWESNSAPHTWTEDESKLYLELAPVAAPAREEQIATIVSLLPFDTQAQFSVLDLGAGEGTLDFAILESYPSSSVIALDGSESMCLRAGACLERFGERASVRLFELRESNWLSLVSSSDVVVSSMLFHHFPDEEKLQFFNTVYSRLRQPGALLIADVLKAQRPEQRGVYADGYDMLARAQSLSTTGSEDAYNVFRERRWNMFRYDSLPADEYPSPLIDSLSWLRSAGFQGVDCFWMRSGFAVFGGYKGSPRTGAGITLDAAIGSARLALTVAGEIPPT